jgi:hypothetical protein
LTGHRPRQRARAIAVRWGIDRPSSAPASIPARQRRFRRFQARSSANGPQSIPPKPKEDAMDRLLSARKGTITLACSLALLGGCGGGDGAGTAEGPTADPLASKAVVLVSPGPNLVSRWHAVATAAINVPPSPAGATPEERVGGPDIATVQIAVYDTVMAIAGTHEPFATTPSHRSPARRWTQRSTKRRTACCAACFRAAACWPTLPTAIR